MFNNLKRTSDKKLTTKILATFLVVTLTSANIILLGSYMGKGFITYAQDYIADPSFGNNTEIDLNNQTSETNIEDVKFSAYFDGDVTKYTAINDLNSEDIKLFVKVEVKNGGILNNAKIELSNTNFLTSEGKNQIQLGTVNSEQGKTIEIPIKSVKPDNIYIDLLNMQSRLTLTGEYINANSQVENVLSNKYVKVIWNTSNINQENNPIQLSHQILTNKVYNLNGQEKRIIQVHVTSGIENNIYPIQGTVIELTPPDLGENELEQAVVATYSSKATNGNKELSTWKFDQTTEGKVQITIPNTPVENKIVWSKEGQDEFIITYIYKEKDINVENIQSKASSEITLLKDINLTANASKTMSANSEREQSITLNILTPQNLYKGNMYLGNKINYSVNWNLGVSLSSITPELNINSISDSFYMGETKVEQTNSQYISTYINKQEVDRVLGQNGQIKIYNKETLLTTINSQTQAIDGIIEIIYKDLVPEGTPINEIRIIITAPEGEGLLNIIHNKEISTQEPVDNINSLVTSALFGEDVINTIVKQIKMEEPKQEVDFSINKAELSATQENEAEFTITLKTDSDKYKLYNNPVFEIKLPEFLNTKINTQNIQILNAQGLVIKEAVLNKNTLVLSLEGQVSEYAKANPQIVFKVGMQVNKLIPTTASQIILNVGEETSKNINVNFTAENEILLGTTVYKNNGVNSEIFATKNNTKIEDITTTEQPKIVTVKGTIINNTKDSSNVVVIGKIAGETSTIVPQLKSIISLTEGTNGTIYYSEKEDASLEDETWETGGSIVSKSYKIVINSMEAGKTAEFNYNVEIPAQLEKNKELIINYKIVNEANEINSPKIILQSPKHVQLDLELTSTIPQGQTAFVGQQLTYTIKLTNNGEVKANNIIVNNLLPLGVIALNNAQTRWEIEELPIGETITKAIDVTVNDIEGQTSSILNTITVTADDMGEALQKTLENSIRKSKIKTNIRYDMYNNTSASEVIITAQVGAMVFYYINIENISNTALENINVQMTLPQGVDLLKICDPIYEKELEGITKNENTYNYKLNLQAEQKNTILIKCVVNKQAKENIKLVVDITKEDTIRLENNISVKTPINIVTNMSNNIEGQNILPGDLIIYTLTVKNTGETPAGIEVQDVMPTGLRIIKYAVTESNAEKRIYDESTTDRFIGMFSLEQNEELKVEFLAQAQEVEENTVVSNYATITGEYIDNIKTNAVENKIVVNPDEPEEPENPNKPEDPNEPVNPEQKTYKISGLAWIDENSDGKMENTEKLLKGVLVKIKNSDTNEYLKTAQNETVTVITDKNGVYEFTDLVQGNYIVEFEYNQNTYAVTTYQAKGVISSLNSDAITSTIEGTKTTKTDIINLTSANAENINIGLILNPIYDLKLDKYITKVTVKNANGTEEHNYEKTQLAKVEIKSKYLPSSTVIIEYTLVITNQGAIPAEVKTIVDYIPKDLKFNSELNDTWYQANDGQIYCIDLANEEIKPGEEKQVKLILTKTMTLENTGTTANIAEIFESFNEYALKDIDSVEANKEEKEDDMSCASIIISVGTGVEISYIAILLVCILIVGGGIYMINKKVLITQNNKRRAE